MTGPTEFSADLASMKQLGLYHLRDYAHTHLDAAEKLESVECLRPQLFRSPVSTSNVRSVSYSTWLDILTSLQSVLKNNVTNIVDTGEGLSKLADRIYDQDLSTAEQLEYDNLMKGYEKGDPETGEGAHGKPPELPGPAPEPRDTPDETDIPTRNFDEGDLVDLPVDVTSLEDHPALDKDS